MKVLQFLAFFTSIAFMIVLDAVLWGESSLYGIGGIIGIISFFIAYAISGNIVVAPRDFWKLSSWQVFKKKIGWAFSAYIIVALVAAAVLSAMFN